MENLYIKLTTVDRAILSSYCSFIDGLGEYMGEGYEIVVHSLENLERSAVKIINGHHSGRREGAPITDLALQMLSKMEHNSHHALCYSNKSKSGAPMKSTTIPITGERDRIIGLICINFYTDTPLSAILSNLFPQTLAPFTTEAGSAETFSENVDDLISKALAEVRGQVYTDTAISASNKNKEIIAQLHARGIFNLKDAVVKVAAQLNISKNTVYMHIRNLN